VSTKNLMRGRIVLPVFGGLRIGKGSAHPFAPEVSDTEHTGIISGASPSNSASAPASRWRRESPLHIATQSQNQHEQDSSLLVADD
jgi:hypothetical protein